MSKNEHFAEWLSAFWRSEEYQSRIAELSRADLLTHPQEIAFLVALIERLNPRRAGDEGAP